MSNPSDLPPDIGPNEEPNADPLKPPRLPTLFARPAACEPCAGLDGSAREGACLAGLAAAAGGAQPLEALLPPLRCCALELLGVDRAAVFLLNDLAATGSWGIDFEGRFCDEHETRPRLEELKAQITPLREKAQPWTLERREVAIPDTLARQDLIEPREFLTLGLYAQGELVGLLCADNLISGRPLPVETFPRLLPCCALASVVIENASLLAERKRLLERRRHLQEITAAINNARELDHTLYLVRDAIAEIGVFDRVRIILVQGDHGQGAWGTDRQGRLCDERHRFQPLHQWTPYLEELQAQGRPYILHDAAETTEGSGRSCATLALRADGALLGLLFADNLITGRPIAEADLVDLLPFTEQAATALRNARLLAERERHLERQQRLAGLTGAISASADLNDILRMVRDAAVEAGGFDRAGVFLYDRKTRQLLGTWGTDKRGQREDISEETIPLEAESQKPLFRVMRGELAYSLNADFTRDLNLPPEDPQYGIGAHAIVPLRADQEILGVLCVDNLLSDAPISEEDVEGLLPFAEHAAIAIRNARLFSDLNHAQVALTRSEKMRAVGELASGIAHNVNNVLAAILHCAELIQEEENVPAKIAQYARIIERATLDGSAIVDRVRRFARQDTETEMAPFDLAETIQEAIDLTRPAWLNQASGRGARIEIVTHLAPHLTAVGLEFEIREVLVNLIRNAADAMLEGGLLTICCFEEEGQGLITVADTGVGMDALTRERVFEPFFSTKGAAMGTGLGLSVAWSILERHKGSIEVDSEPGQGARFRLRLPLAEGPCLKAEASSDRRSLAGMRLLLVEDEELIVSGLAQMLLARGAAVDFCRDAQEAMGWLADHAARCDIVISDHGMVGLTGLELLGHVRERYPRLRRVLLSGWGENLPNAPDTSNAELILAKPVRLETLITALLDLLHGPSAGEFP